MERWWNISGEGSEESFLVVEAKLHDPACWKLDVLVRLSVLVSEATRDLLDHIQRGLTVTPDAEDPDKIAAADLSFTVDAERAERVRALLAQEKRDEKTGNLLPFSNAYRFISCAEDGDRFRVVSRLALGDWKEREDRKGNRSRTHALSMIPATTGMQQLLGTYLAQAELRTLPRTLQSGVCQEVAQQVTSYLGQLESSKVKGEVAFPSVEDRNPKRRRRTYEAAIDALTRDVRPLCYTKARDMFPGEYEADDPRGDRLIVDDERWFAVLESPDPHPIPLLFVQGGAVRILEGVASFDAGISKQNRHRGRFTSNERVLADRPEQVRRKGATRLQAWYAALPLLDADDEIIRGILEARKEDGGRGLDLNLRLMPIQGGGRWRRRDAELLVPLSGNRDRLERILRRSNLEVAWSRLVHKRGEWFLQITCRVRGAATLQTQRVIGVSFGIDAVATWCVMDETGAELHTGELAPNEQILTFLREKRGLEWDQQKGRWVGGKRFGRSLESIAHRVANDLLDLTRQHEASVAVEDISWVQKAGPDHERNVIFTAWNYGQMRRILGYKSPLAGLGEVIYCSDYVISFTCPSCGAMRKKDEKPETSATWRENLPAGQAGGTLHCRKCGFSGVISSAERARRVALHRLAVIRERAHRKAKKEATG